MRRFFSAIITVALIGAIAPAIEAVQVPLQGFSALSNVPAPVIPGQYIVLMKGTATQDVLARHSIKAHKVFSRVGGFSAQLTNMQLARLRSDKSIAIVEPDRMVYAFAKYQCWDKIDNDGDGLIDWLRDPDCSSPLDMTEGSEGGSSSSSSSSSISSSSSSSSQASSSSSVSSSSTSSSSSSSVSSSSSESSASSVTSSSSESSSSASSESSSSDSSSSSESSSSASSESSSESSSSTPLSSSSSSEGSSSSSSSSQSSTSSSSQSSAQSSSASFSGLTLPSGIPVPTGIDRIDAEFNAKANMDAVNEPLDIDIAIIDTGVQASHPDLRVVNQANFSRDSSADDLNGHGTHVAGTAAALDNGIGVVGAAPGARIWSVKVLDRRGSGNLSDVIAGIDYVTQNAAAIEVANMSLGCECQTAIMDEAIRRSVAAGVVYVVAAGNSGKDSARFSPANHADVITVSAIADFNGKPGGGAPATCMSDIDETFANFSNFGAPVDIAAPGVCITSTWRNSRYSTISGTSMASPHVTGAVALYLIGKPKPASTADVLAVKAALVSAAFAQNGPDGFSGDPDSFAEPLLNAAGL